MIYRHLLAKLCPPFCRFRKEEYVASTIWLTRAKTNLKVGGAEHILSYISEIIKDIVFYVDW